MNQEEIIIIVVCSLLLGLEWLFPLRSYSLKSPQKIEDLFWSALHFLVYPLMMATISFGLGKKINGFVLEQTSLFNFSALNIFLQVIIFLLFTDFFSYWIHRGFHSIKPLWELHRLHHSTTELTVLSSFRTNWLEFLSNSIIIGAITGVLTVQSDVRLWVNVGLSFVCVFQHSNLKLRYPEFFEKIFITPKNHFWHHSKEMKHKYGQNFGFLFPWWDMLFDTLHNPANTNTELGLSDDFHYSSNMSKLIYPFDKPFRKKD